VGSKHNGALEHGEDDVVAALHSAGADLDAIGASIMRYVHTGEAKIATGAPDRLTLNTCLKRIHASEGFRYTHGKNLI